MHHANGFEVSAWYNGHDSVPVLKTQLLQCATAHWMHKQLNSSTTHQRSALLTGKIDTIRTRWHLITALYLCYLHGSSLAGRSRYAFWRFPPNRLVVRAYEKLGPNSVVKKPLLHMVFRASLRRYPQRTFWRDMKLKHASMPCKLKCPTFCDTAKSPIFQYFSTYI